MKKHLLILLFSFLLFNSYAQLWTPVGAGVGREISCMTEYNGELIMGGWFSSPGNCIATYNGSTFGTLGTGFSGFANNFLTAVCVYNGNLYAAGNFLTAGGVTSPGIAKWDGTSWSTVGTGLSSAAGFVLVNTLCVYNNELYVGGLFENAGGVSVNNLARWDGNSWGNVGGEIDSTGMVITMAVHKGSLYVAGAFTSAGGVAVDRIARWNGTAWSALGTGNTFTGGNPLAMASNGTDLFLGGGFTDIGSTNVDYIARWNDTIWSAMGTGADAKVTALFGYNGDIYVGGDFTTMNGNTVNHVAKWSNSTWSGMHTGTSHTAYAFAVYNWGLYMGGIFTQASGSAANYLARWDAAIGMNESAEYLNSASLYPNPFSGYAQLNIPANYGPLSEMVISIYDISGREVKTIQPSSNTVLIDGSDLSSGLYMYRISNSSKVFTTKKFVIE